MSLRHFCTYFDRNYLLKGLALYRSLCQNENDFVLWVLCLDAETKEILTRIGASQIRIVDLRELEAWEPGLLAARADRSLIEYYWTCTPAWLAYLLAQLPSGEVATYLDADLFFFGSTGPIFAEMGPASILIHEHRFPPGHPEQARVSGIYNVGLIAFKHDILGQQALQWWRSACLTACYQRPEDGYFGDQKYLDDWPERFAGVHILQNVGAGLAPWNVANYSYAYDSGHLQVQGTPLVFFHFHGFRQVAPHLFVQRTFNIPESVRQYVYRPYIDSLGETFREVRAAKLLFRASFASWTWNQLARDILRGRAFLDW